MWVNVGGEEESQERYGLLIEKVIIFPLGRNFHKYRGSNDGESFISCSLQV